MELISKCSKSTWRMLRPGVCLYEDGAWKLSNSADNSWASKICLNQFVVRHILQVDYEGSEKADSAPLDGYMVQLIMLAVINFRQAFLLEAYSADCYGYSMAEHAGAKTSGELTRCFRGNGAV